MMEFLEEEVIFHEYDQPTEREFLCNRPRIRGQKTEE